jgi:hypothetical protein
VDQLLVRLLRGPGHDVRLPIELGVAGNPDPIHLRNAIREDRVFLSKNHDDFLYLHELIPDAAGHHPGILIVRRDNDRKRDLTAQGIVWALTKLQAAKVPLVDQFYILNHWR